MRQTVRPNCIFLGLGLGDFFDGIVPYQILQWHHMISAQTDPSTQQMHRSSRFNYLGHSCI
ncbi:MULTISPECIES: DUF2243 domain-containing protein [Natrialba]|uniref:DUF2243 domain-containing protein n=1 Tax=Natrialba TaxID=63742 RepID=UPI00195528D4